MACRRAKIHILCRINHRKYGVNPRIMYSVRTIGAERKSGAGTEVRPVTASAGGSELRVLNCPVFSLFHHYYSRGNSTSILYQCKYIRTSRKIFPV